MRAKMRKENLITRREFIKLSGICFGIFPSIAASQMSRKLFDSILDMPDGWEKENFSGDSVLEEAQELLEAVLTAETLEEKLIASENLATNLNSIGPNPRDVFVPYSEEGLNGKDIMGADVKRYKWAAIWEGNRVVAGSWVDSEKYAQYVDEDMTSMHPMIYPAATNTEGKTVVRISDQNGETSEIELTPFMFPGQEEPRDIADFYKGVSQEELIQQAGNIMEKSVDSNDTVTSRFQDESNPKFALPVYMLESFTQNEKKWVYFRTTEAPAKVPTNTCLVPLVDKESGLVYACAVLHQGVAGKNESYTYNQSGGNFERIQLGYFTNGKFGDSEKIRTAILTGFSDPQFNEKRLYNDGFLEMSPYIGSIPELETILSGDFEQMIGIFQEKRLLVFAPPYVFHQEL